jgi:hypothetical protein
VQLRTKDKQRATPCKECLQRKEPPKIKSGFCCVQSNERVRINAPVIRSERSVIIVSQHQLQWPPDDPKARNHAEHFDNVILGATRKSAVVSEFWCEFEVLWTSYCLVGMLWQCWVIVAHMTERVLRKSQKWTKRSPWYFVLKKKSEAQRRQPGHVVGQS